MDAEHTRITVVTKRRRQLSLFTDLTEGTFQRRCRQAVGILKTGPLPTHAPPYQ